MIKDSVIRTARGSTRGPSCRSGSRRRRRFHQPTTHPVLNLFSLSSISASLPTACPGYHCRFLQFFTDFTCEFCEGVFRTYLHIPQIPRLRTSRLDPPVSGTPWWPRGGWVTNGKMYNGMLKTQGVFRRAWDRLKTDRAKKLPLLTSISGISLYRYRKWCILCVVGRYIGVIVLALTTGFAEQTRPALGNLG